MNAGAALALVAAAFIFQAPTLAAQSFVNDTVSIPSGAPFNGGDHEQVDFGDLDLDGDLDVVLAKGGDFGNEQDRVWINSAGVFSDDTAARFPAVLDNNRDLEFVDPDLDGDLDLHTAATSAYTNQSCRFLINMGGAQGGTPGFYQDQTSTRWLGLGSPGSSIAPSQVLASGGFIDWCSDADFGDFDADGDADLFHSSIGIPGMFNGGRVPMRVFLNGGSGTLVEFNPSGFQLSGNNIVDGNPGLWCEGVQLANAFTSDGSKCDVAEEVIDSDLADSDGDLDLDVVVCGDVSPSRPRVYHCRLVENGGQLGFRDMTAFAMAASGPSGCKYEQEWGDVDDDGDVDLYGLNWDPNSCLDRVLTNDGSGAYALGIALPNSYDDEEEADFLDFEADGDVYVASFSGQDRLYSNGLIGGGPTFANASAQLPTVLTDIGRDVDCADVDGDGDTDAFVANSGSASHYVRNTTQIADTRAPRVTKLEQAANRAASNEPTLIRAHVYDNQPDYMTAFANVAIEWSTGGPFTSAPMTWMGGQLFRGEIPGSLHGLVSYWVSAVDAQGNAGVSTTLHYISDASGVAYCTAGTTANGCVPSSASFGTASVASTSGFVIAVTNVDGQRSGILFYGASGRLAQPWTGGSSSFLCVHFPVQRTGLQSSGGTAGACNGAFSLDWRAYLANNTNALGNPLAAGEQFNAQAWFRDPPSPAGTSLSDALEFFVVP